jgi:pilus assembly protein CpaB
MRPISIVLLVVAGIAALGVVFIGKRVVQDRANAAAAAQKVAIADVEVLVAARDLPQGHVLLETDLRWDRWPTATAQAVHAIVRDKSQDTRAQAPGTAARRNITAGEPISADNLFTPGRNSGFMAAMVLPGMKAVGVTVTAASTASGFVLPGDLVDVVLTVDLRRNEVALPGGGRYASEVILHGVRVLAVDQTLTPGTAAPSSRSKRISSKSGAAQANDAPPEDVAMVGKTVALEVTPADGERLLAAQAAGTLSLALRSLAISEAKEDTKSFASDVDSSRALRMAVGGGVKVIRGGDVAH